MTLHSFQSTQQSCSIQTVQDTGSDHLTEDAFYAGAFEHHAVMLVADGAPLRLRPVNSLRPLLDKFASRYGEDITPSGIASRLTRDVAAQALTVEPALPLADAVLTANRHLAAELEAIYGDLSAETLLKHEPGFTILAEDARYRRLMLPVCTYTVVRVDFRAENFEVVHGADSALFVFRSDGSVEQITPDQMRQHDDAFKRLWMNGGNAPSDHPFFAALGDSQALALNRMNGLYHNYVDAAGLPDPTVGVSVVNGLPEIADYMFKATGPLAGIDALLVTSDGMFWPALPDETADDEARRLLAMRQRIERDGLQGYISALRAEETRLIESGINYGHDDATAILLTL
jgi:hypothetical protein